MPSGAEAAAAAGDRWCRTFVVARGLPAELVDQPGCTIVDVEGRAGTGVASAYALGEHVVVFTDPDHHDALKGFEPTGDPMQAYRRFAEAAGAEVLGTGVQRTLLATPAADPSPALVRLRRESEADVARLNAFFDQCSEDDLDEAAIERDDLDPVIFCIEAAEDGPLVAYASAFPDEDFAGEWDIGVVTHPDHRRQGLGRRCVQHLCAHLLAEGGVPLYRHDVVNTSSAALAEAAGFVPASWVTAIKFSTAG